MRQQDTTSWIGPQMKHTDAELARVSVLTRNLSRQQCTCHLWQASGKVMKNFNKKIDRKNLNFGNKLRFKNIYMTDFHQRLNFYQWSFT